MIKRTLTITYKTALNFLLFLALACSFYSCEKKFKESSSANVTVKIVNPIVSERLVINSGVVFLSSFGLSGNRKQSDDVSFSKTFSNETSADLSTGSITPLLNFDLFQGTYTLLEINLGISPKLNNGSIVLEGTINNLEDEEEEGNSEVKIFSYHFEPSNSFYWNLTNDGEKNIVPDQNCLINIEFDATYLFSAITETQWQNCAHELVNGEEIIYITAQKNPDIYNILSGRINAAFSARIQ